MITSINIKNVATYDSTGIQINDLKKVNFIYGANGTGKTTLSNFLSNPNSEDEKFKDCLVEWRNNAPLTTLVYNKKFKELNFGQGGKIKGIFTLGQATKEQIEEINNKKEQLDEIKKNIDGIEIRRKTEQDKLQEIKDNFKESCWIDIYKDYEDDFKEAFLGALSKERFKDRLLNEFQNNSTSLLTYEQLKDKAQTIFGESPQTMSVVNTISYEEVLQIQNNSIWKTKIIGKSDVDIASLIQRLGINDWVNEGRKYLQEDSETCPFCQQQTITDGFKDKLNQFFDETYTKNITELKKLQQQYSLLMDNIINELNSIESYQKTFPNTKLDVDKFSVYLKTLTSQNNENKIKIENKVKEPSREIELVSLQEQLNLLSELINLANVEIQEHNAIVANFQTEKNNLIKAVWKFLTEEFKDKIESFNREKNNSERAIQGINNQLQSKKDQWQNLDTEIKMLSKNITSIQPTVDEINRLLNSFGFHNFKIVSSSENGFYEIQREDGTSAEETLSEGEITFITFLYYYQKIKGGDTAEEVNEDRILVIDDPISSLDSNILFIVSTLIKDLIKEMKRDDYVGSIKQILILTHNVYFHKEVSFMDKGADSDKLNFWILRKNGNVTNIQAYGKQNPIQSSYAMLWNELKNENLSSTLTIQNIMRRILENYFKVLGNYKNEEDIIQLFPNIQEQQICRSLYHWINDGSHCFSDALEIDDQNVTIDVYKKVFKAIFEYTEQEGHYKMMMGN
ncbi:AAA family ATPase [Capnocytophaga cynodegmi]|uniref:AAA family ATPase n=1 Tax=Capnocytophaga cynodegmi TaxID=28189 RepID=UPI003858F03F